MSKKLLYLLIAGLLFLVHANAFSQKQKPKNDSWYDEKRIHFGFSIGLNMMDFNIDPSKRSLPSPDSSTYLLPEVSTLNPGINIQIVTNLHIANYLDLRFLPGVSFGQRNIRFYEIQKSNDSLLGNYKESEQQRIESSYLEFPFTLKYKGARLNNVRPYVIGGINFRYDLAGKKELDDEKKIWLRLKRPDLYYEAGAGMDFYLRYFKLSVELKMSNGIRDVLVHRPERSPEFINAIDRMSSQIWILAFHFE